MIQPQDIATAQVLIIIPLGIIVGTLFLYDWNRGRKGDAHPWWSVLRLFKGLILVYFSVIYALSLMGQINPSTMGVIWFRPALVVLFALIGLVRWFEGRLTTIVVESVESGWED